LRAELERAVAEKDAQIELLNKRLQELRDKLSASSAASAEAETEVQMLNGLIQQLKSQRDDSAGKLGALPSDTVADAVAAAPAANDSGAGDGPAAGGPSAGGASDPGAAAATEDGLRTRQPIRLDPNDSVRDVDAVIRSYSGVSLGRYFALLIGNQNYSSIESLTTPLSDLERARKILEERYGFTVFTVQDGDNVAVMKAINDLYEVIGEEDNLLLFYAGHGNRLNTGGAEIGYWLPSNAEAPPRNTFWVANEFVTGHLSRIRAKRVLVVADSCYAGLLSTEPSFLMVGDNGPQYSNMEFLKFKLGKRSRLLLSSGGDQPVLDEGGGNNSVFAKAFLDELERNDRLLPSPELFLRLRETVTERAAALKFQQTPEFKTIKAAGHEVGDFFFVPVAAR
ncbi:MAG: caspase domain-containing protein, partial [Gammaproteobacteria bacterium]